MYRNEIERRARELYAGNLGQIMDKKKLLTCEKLGKELWLKMMMEKKKVKEEEKIKNKEEVLLDQSHCLQVDC